MECDMGCQCGTIYMHFMFGNDLKIDDKIYKENAMRFAALTQHCKLRFSLGKTLDLYFGLQMMDERTYGKYKDCVNEKANVLAERYMNEAINEGIDKLISTVTHCSMDGSYNTQGHQSKLGQNTTILRTFNKDQRTGRNYKVVANYRRNREVRYGQDHVGSAGQIEVDGMRIMMNTLNSKVASSHSSPSFIL